MTEFELYQIIGKLTVNYENQIAELNRNLLVLAKELERIKHTETKLVGLDNK